MLPLADVHFVTIYGKTFEVGNFTQRLMGVLDLVNSWTIAKFAIHSKEDQREKNLAFY